MKALPRFIDRRIGLPMLTALFLLWLAPGANAAFGIEEFSGAVVDKAGVAEVQAGAHPHEAWATIEFNGHDDSGHQVPDADVRDVHVDLPPGFVGNPNAMPQCPQRVIFTHDQLECPATTQVGIAEFLVTDFFPNTIYSKVFNMVPPEGVPAQFAMNVSGIVVALNAAVRDDGTYGLTVSSTNVSQQTGLVRARTIFWGLPADSSHDDSRGTCFSLNLGPTGLLCPVDTPEVPFLTNPMNCSAGPLTTTLRATPWFDPSIVRTASFDHDVNGTPMAVEGCEGLRFEPRMELRPTTREADSPSGLDVELNLPQPGLTSPTGLATPHLKRAEVVLPEGVTVGPASASGLAACSPDQIGLIAKSPARFNQATPSCPEGSKIGTVEVVTPLLEERLNGGVYLAKQGDNAFGSLLSVYLVAESKERGITVKLAGKVTPDPQTGRLTATFDNNPQLPFSNLRVRFKGGDRAALMTPPACGTYTTTTRFSSWSAADPDSPTAAEVVTSTSSFTIDRGPGGGPCPDGKFAPELDAGTTNPIAGSYSPFVLRLHRADGTQRFGSLSATLPEGLTGKLAGIPYCSDAALAGVSGAEGSGKAQIQTPSCPAASQVGTVTVGAGAGPSPFYVDTGRAYLAGPYKGAPLSMAFVTPAVAGPFDLGSVLVRAALQVNPTTAQVTAVSDPLPSILHGIPLDLRDVRIEMNRSDFMINPTDCSEMSIAGTATSTQGTNAPISERFQAADCAALRFKPRLAMRFFGKTHRSAHPRLRATLTMPQHGANIERAVVTMPRTEFLENAHIRTICTRVQWAAKTCPKAAIYGYAKAWTPLLDQPLQGPVYLRSSDNELPDLVADLDGQIEIDLVGRIDAVNERIRNTFLMVPDAAVSKFVLTMQGGKKGLLVNNTNLCKAKPRMNGKFTGQNGKVHRIKPLVKTDCGKKKAKRGGSKKRAK